MRAPSLPPVRGLDPFSLTAWEGKVSAVIHLQGCNLKCRACPVPHLVPMRPESGVIPFEGVLHAIYERKRWLDAVVVSGGEPTLHETLPDMVRLLHDFGLRVRIHTNGTNPEMLRTLLDGGEVGSVAMTVRAPLDATYAIAAGAKVALAAVYESVERILRDDGEHEFRVPWLPGVVEHAEIVAILRMLSGARRVVLEESSPSTPGSRALRRVAREAGRQVDSCVLAGRPGEDYGALAPLRGDARKGRVAT